MDKLTIGVIGAGSISDMHLQSYQKNQRVQLYAICDSNVQRAEEKAKKYSIPNYYSEYQALLSEEKIDAVSICTWNHSHAEIAIAALRAGKHVLVEKPLCTTVEEAQQIEETVKQTGKVL